MIAICLGDITTRKERDTCRASQGPLRHCAWEPSILEEARSTVQVPGGKEGSGPRRPQGHEKPYWSPDDHGWAKDVFNPRAEKISAKSSTKAEVIGASDILPQCIWTKNFIEAQGYI